MKSILDPAFRYTSSADTDLRKTFARVRHEMRKAAADKRGAQVASLAPGFRRDASLRSGRKLDPA